MLRSRSVRNLVIFFVLLWSAGAAVEAKPSPRAKPADRAARVRRVAEAGVLRTVGIVCNVETQSGFYGTGAVITPDGYVITSTTVVPPGADEIKVYFDGLKIRKAKIVETNKELEATLIKVEARDLPFFPLAREMPTVGQAAYTFSNAHEAMQMGSRASFSMGVFSGVYDVEELSGESSYHGPALETSAAVNPGSDGGPIVNQCVQLCGILSLNSSPRRWQGISVPIAQVLERFGAFKSGELKVSFEPLLPAPTGGELESLAAHAREVSDYLVGISVLRKYPAEVLPRMSWGAYRQKIKDWNPSSGAEKPTQDSYAEVEHLLETNQILRRPAAEVTGMVISPEGHILTSAFNVGDDVVFKDRKSGNVRPIEFRATEADLLKGAAKRSFVADKNPIEKILVTLPDGSQREAKLLARHELLGVALLKIDAKGLKYCDLEKAAAPPELAMPVGLVGYVGGKLTRHTLNVGIVSAPSRSRDMHFQTDALLNYGNSGGPVVSAQGRVLGIGLAPIEPRTVMGRVFGPDELEHWTTAPNSGVSMICRMDRLLPVLGELKAGKSTSTFRGPQLGILVDPQYVLSDRVMIAGVLPDSPAQKAGLKRGDRIVKLDGTPTSSWKELTDQIGRRQPGDKVELEIYRKNIGRHLLLKGQMVENEADLKALVDKLKPGEQFQGTLIESDTKVITVILGESK